MTSHICRAKGCSVIVGYQFLMCSRHWRMVPKTQQKRVWHEWSRVCSNSGELHPQYLAAVADAISAVAEAEGR
jgi:hypothetical protein